MASTTEEITEAPGGRPHPEGGDHGDHPSDWFYIKVAIFLAVVTAIEVALYYWEIGAFNTTALLVLAVLKFVTVAAFFMHLKTDNKVLRRFFYTGIFTALVVYIWVLLTYGALIRNEDRPPPFGEVPNTSGVSQVDTEPDL